MLSETATERSAPHYLKLLAHDVRWHLLAALARSDLRVHEMVEQVEQPQNLVSYHLRLLREGGLVNERRSSADGRDVYYSLDLDQLRTGYLDGGQALHPALSCREPAPDPSSGGGTAQRILFLCTHNSARSQLAEGILRAGAGELVDVHSAGNEPGRVHPLAINAAAELGIDIRRQRSKHMDEFSGRQFDMVITVCDRVRERCPVFPDDPRQIHWSLADPAAVEGSPEIQMAAFRQTAQELLRRTDYLRLDLDWHKAQ